MIIMGIGGGADGGTGGGGGGGVLSISFRAQAVMNKAAQIRIASAFVFLMEFPFCAGLRPGNAMCKNRI